MNMQRCENGHYYDKSKSEQCPYCNPINHDVSRTVAVDQLAAPDFGTAIDFSTGGYGCTGIPTFDGDGGIGVTQSVQTSSEMTQIVTPQTASGKRYDPVVGWVVCIEGPDRGTDYRIRTGNNSVGRGAKALIRIVGDTAISQEDMSIIAYSAPTKQYFVIAGGTRNQTFVNGQVVIAMQSRELHAFDRITIGATTLLFVPLCGGEFSWE